MKKQNKPSLYWFFVFLLTVVLCFLSVYGLAFADDFLTEYEYTRPQNVLRRFLDSVSEKNLSYLIEICNYEENEFVTENDIREYLKEKFDNRFSDVTFLQSPKFSGKTNARYNLFLDGGRKGSIYLETFDAKSKFGFTMWRIVSADIIDTTKNYTITVPYDADVIINQKQLSDKYVISTDYVVDTDLFSEEDAPRTKTYKISGLLSKPNITAKINETPIYRDFDDGEKITFIRNNDRYGEVTSLISESLYQYIMTVSLDDDLSKYLSFLVPNTEYYNNVTGYHKGWSMYQPENMKVEIGKYNFDFYREYSDNIVYSEVSFEFTIISDYAMQTYPASYKIYTVKTEDGWKILNMENK